MIHQQPFFLLWRWDFLQDEADVSEKLRQNLHKISMTKKSWLKSRFIQMTGRNLHLSAFSHEYDSFFNIFKLMHLFDANRKLMHPSVCSWHASEFGSKDRTETGGEPCLCIALPQMFCIFSKPIQSLLYVQKVSLESLYFDFGQENVSEEAGVREEAVLSHW